MANGINFSDISPIMLKIGFDVNSKDLDSVKKNAEEVTSSLEKAQKRMGDTVKSWKDQWAEIKNSAKSAFSFGLITGGIMGLVNEAKNAAFKINEMTASMKEFTTSPMSASKALQFKIGVWGQTKGSLDTVHAAMTALNAQGFTPSHEGATQLTSDLVDLQLAGTAGFDSMSQLTAGMVYSWGLTTQGATKLLNSVLALGPAFGFTNKQMETMMGTVGDINKKMAAFYNNAESGSNAMTKGISAAIGVMRNFNVTVEEGGDFMKRMLDPEQIQENMTLYSRLGMSYGDITSMMESDAGKEMFFDKMMNNLPKVSKEIMAIKDPIARLQFSKKLGMPLEMAAKMAKATGAELDNLQQEYKKQAEENQIAEKKKQAVAELRQKYEEKLELMKLQMMGPLSELIMKLMPIFLTLLKSSARVIELISRVFAKLATNFIPLFETLASDIAKVTGAYKYQPGEKTSGVSTTGKVAMAAGAAYGAYKIFSGVKDFIGGFKGKRGESASAPLFVKDVGAAAAAKAVGLLDKAKGLREAFQVGKSGGFMTAKNFVKPITGVRGGLLQMGKAAGMGPGVLKSLAFMTGPVGLGLMAGAAAIAGGVAGYKKSGEYFGLKKGEKVSAGKRAAGTAAGALTLGILPLIDKFFGTHLTAAFARGIYNLKFIFVQGWNKIVALFPIAWSKFKRLVAGYALALIGIVTGPFLAIGAIIVGGLVKGFNWLRKTFKPIDDIFQKIAKSKVGQFFKGLWDSIMGFVNKIKAWFSSDDETEEVTDIRKKFAKAKTSADVFALKNELYNYAKTNNKLNDEAVVELQETMKEQATSFKEQEDEKKRQAAADAEADRQRLEEERKNQEKDSKNLEGIAGATGEMNERDKKKEADSKKIKEKSTFLDLWYTNNQVLKVSVGGGR